MVEQETMVDQFQVVTGSNKEEAWHILEAYGWDLESGIDFYFQERPQHGSRPSDVLNEACCDAQEPAVEQPERNSFEGLQVGARDPWKYNDMGVIDVEDDEGNTKDDGVDSIRVSGQGIRIQSQQNDEDNRPSIIDITDEGNDVELSNTHATQATAGTGTSAWQQDQNAVQQRLNSVDFPPIGETSQDPQLPAGINIEEAKMLEAAMLGIPYEGNMTAMNTTGLSPEAQERQNLRDEIDAAYQESLRVDRMKMEAAEARDVQLAEQAKQQQEQAAAQEQLERETQAREAAELALVSERLPAEPAANGQGVVMIQIRLPDGSKVGRRFLTSDSISSLFDYVTVQLQRSSSSKGIVKLVRQYPMKRFSQEDSGTLQSCGLDSSMEALFLQIDEQA